jgi:membrane-bound metal-dependent hydrolase YbcI (DUF457 family)
MKPITHMAFSGLFCMVLATVANIVLKPMHFILIAAASLIPNLDHSAWLERIFGRRTFTHSLLGFVIFAVAALPFVVFKANSLYFIHSGPYVDRLREQGGCVPVLSERCQGSPAEE